MTEASTDAQIPLIAITGMAGRFPGARDLAEFWRNLRDGIESISFLTDPQLLAAGADPDELRNPAYVKAAPILEDIDLFDAAFFGFSPKDAAIMDPQHRLFLECAWQALENAGWSADQFDGRIGVYAGSGMNTYLIHNLLANRKLVAEAGLFLLKQTGNDKDVLATRVSYQLNLTGPSLAVQTACSTSLVAVHLACQALIGRECDMALAGGVTIELPHGRGYLYREGEILSQDGHCRAFDAQSSGTVFSSGLGIVVLRRLQDAVRDGDCIHAVICATAINNDGARKVGFLAPSAAGQAEVIAEALALAGVDAGSVSYVETHGTGTKVGDPIEIEALTRAFRQTTAAKGYCAIGSVKTNVGHLDAAAGVAGLIKTVLALGHRQIPPSLNFTRPNPLIDFDSGPFFVSTGLRDWEVGAGVRRAGVTSLGIGGTNAHVVLEEAPEHEPSQERGDWQLLTLSAKTPAALDTMASNLADYLDQNPANLADVAFTTHLGRKAFAHRRALVCRDRPEAAALLRRNDDARIVANVAPDREPAVVFMFPGQGAQHPAMAQELYESEPEFRSIVDFCCDFLGPYLELDLREIIFPTGAQQAAAPALLTQTRITQPALFVIEYALARLWASVGVLPAAMIGHSVGEFAAACMAGVFSLEDTLRIVAQRGRLIQSLPPGSMIAIAASESEVLPLLDARLSLAAVNAQRQCVVAGPDSAVAELEAALAARKVRCRRLQVSHAFHSHMMDPILEGFTGFMRGITARRPGIQWVSNTTGAWIADSEATDPVYWARQLRGTVRFHDGASTLLGNPGSIYLEVGPGATLGSLLAQHPNKSAALEILGSLGERREALSDSEMFVRACAAMWTRGKKIDWKSFHTGHNAKRLPLPTYPFERQHFWIEPDHQPTVAVGNVSPGPAAVAGAPGLFRPVWKGAQPPLRADSPDDNPGWLIFDDSQGLGAQIAGILRGQGEKVITVAPGEIFARISDSQFHLAPGRREDYDKLLAELSERDELPRRILHMWSIVDADRPDSSGAHLSQVQTSSFVSLLLLAQALGSQASAVEFCLGVISNHLHSVAGEPSASPERALLSGPCAVIPKELPNIRCTHIDVATRVQGVPGNIDYQQRLREAAGQIIAEMRGGLADSPVAFRRGRRWIRSYEPLMAAGAPPITLRDAGVYVITGGLGGIGLTLAQAIAQSSRARLALLSRTVLPPRDHWPRLLAGESVAADTLRKIEAIEKSGAEVLLVSADVADEDAMRNALDAVRGQFGPINGVIHAAGVLDDAPLLTKTAPGADRVLSPKVRGTLIIERLLAQEPLDFFVVLSSVSSVLAPAGQVDYTAANAFLDAFAQSRCGQAAFPTVALQYPRWRDVGMAADGGHSTSVPWHQLFRRSAKLRNQEEMVLHTVLNMDRDWIVGEHRTKDGTGLFPGTGYIEAIRSAATAVATSGPITIRELRFELPLAVAQGADRRVEVKLRKDADGYQFSAAAEENGQWVRCASARFTPGDELPNRQVDIDAIRRRCKVRKLTFETRQNQKQASRFDFGPRWAALEQIHLGRREALALLELSSEFWADLSQHQLHPALLDMATGCAMFLIDGYKSLDCAYVPVSYGTLVIRKPLPGKCYSHIRAGNKIGDSLATFDLDILDEEGNPIIGVKDFTLRKIDDPRILTQPSAASGGAASPTDEGSARRTANSQDSVTSTQGVLAFQQLLAGLRAPNVVVFPSDFTVALQRARPLPPRSVTRQAPALSDNDRGPDDMESHLVQWWKELLGVDSVTPQSDFFQLGGQSLAAVRLFANIKKVYGIDLSSATLYESPTIEKLVQRLRKNEPDSTPIRPLVPIRPGGSRPPLFLFPEMKGMIIGFDNLVRYLEIDRPVYGVESVALRRDEPIPLRLEEMAASHVESIRSLQPHGPYYLLGYSFGGLIAFEVATQLIAAGEAVGMLGMLDTWELGYIRELNTVHSGSQKFARRARKALVHARWLLSGPNRLAYFREKLALRVHRRIMGSFFRIVLTRYSRTGRALPRFLHRVQEINWYAAQQYVARPYPGRITMFSAEEGMASNDPRYGKELGWQRIANGGVEIHDVPGEHRDMLKEPNVRILAREITACLNSREDTKLVSPPAAADARAA